MADHFRATWCYLQLPYKITYLKPDTHALTLDSKPPVDLPTPEEWKAEINWAVDYMPNWFTCSN